MKKLNVLISCLVFVLGVVVGILGMSIHNSLSEDTKTTTTTKQELSVEEEILNLIREISLYYTNDDVLLEGALKGIVASLDDPFSSYMNLKEYEEVDNRLNQKFYGIGVGVTQVGPYPMIVRIYEDSPAEQAGLQVGYRIKTVDGTDVKDLSVDDVAALIRGPENTERVIGVFTTNPDEVTTYNIIIKKVDVKTVSYDYFTINDKKVGYLKIDSFMENTPKEVEKAMEYLEGERIDHLIIDVRSNPGGLLSSVRSTLDYFINMDEPFMYAEYRDEVLDEYKLFNVYSHEVTYDIKVLIDENSASAAEIFAAVMNEIGHYDLYGKTTYGKGTMQVTYPVQGVHFVKITTARWLTPSKQWIHGKGVNPTIEVEQEGYQNLAYINGFETIEYDHVGEAIKHVQILLNCLGYEVRSDGYFDNDTLEAIKDYQNSKGLEVTGVVDHATAYYLNLDLFSYIGNKEFDTQYQRVLSDILGS